MKRILAYGDSNTWGFDPASFTRFSEDIRWTGLLQKALEKDALILEEG
jgi:lysophospholipase L1-like esterase